MSPLYVKAGGNSGLRSNIASASRRARVDTDIEKGLPQPELLQQSLRLLHNSLEHREHVLSEQYELCNIELKNSLLEISFL
jgi:hypothetical protein